MSALLLGSKLEDKKNGILESIADLKKCLHHKRIASSDNAVLSNQSFSYAGGSIAHPLNRSHFTSISLSSDKNEDKESTTDNFNETYGRKIQESGCEFSQVCTLEDKRNEFRKSSKKMNNQQAAQETFSPIDWQDSKLQFRKSGKKDQINVETEDILKENRQLHVQLGKLRKENRQKLQELAGEYDNQIQHLKQSHQEELKEMEKKYNGELMSKEEELQAMMLICGNSSARTGSEQYKSQEGVTSTCSSCEQHSKDQVSLKKELEEAHIKLNTFGTEKHQQFEDIRLLNEQQSRMQKEYDTINNQLTQLIEQFHKLQEEYNSQSNENQRIKAENELLLKSNGQLKEENVKITREVQISKKMHLDLLREKQKDLEDLGLKYEKEIESERNKFKDIIAREKEQSNSKMEILVKDNTLLADQITKKKGIQVDKNNQEGQGTKMQFNNQMDAMKTGFFSNPNSLTAQVDTQEEKKVNPIRQQSSFGNPDSNGGLQQAPSQDRTLKNLLNKISNFIEKKDTSSDGRSQQDSAGQSSLNNHYNKKLRVLRQENDTSLNTSQIATLPKSVNSTSHHLIDCYSSCSSTLSSGYLGQARPVSVEKEIGNKSNKYSGFGRESVSFFPHCKSNIQIDNIPKRSQSTHSTGHSSDSPLRLFGQDFYNINHSKSVFSDIPIKNDIISISSKVENQKQRFDQNFKQPRKNYHLNHNYLDSTPKYCFDNKQSHIINQRQCQQSDKENDSLQINRPTVSNIDLKIRQHNQKTTDKWEKMDSLKVENEDENGFISTIKDLYSKIKLTSK